MKQTKLILAVILFILSFITVRAQEALNKGVYSIAGSIQYSYYNQESDFESYSQTTIVVSPQFTYFIKDHLAIGAAINYNYFHTPYDGGHNGAGPVTNSSITFGPSLRYYFFAKPVVPFIEASFNYGIYDLQPQSSENSYNIGVKGGMEIFLSGSVTLEPFISYNYINYKTTFGGLSYTQNNSNLSFGIGINYFIF